MATISSVFLSLALWTVPNVPLPTTFSQLDTYFNLPNRQVLMNQLSCKILSRFGLFFLEASDIRTIQFIMACRFLRVQSSSDLISGSHSPLMIGILRSFPELSGQPAIPRTILIQY